MLSDGFASVGKQAMLTRWNIMKNDLIELSTPGEVFKEEFLDPMDITPYALAKSIFVDPPRITADTALRLSKFFG